MFIKSCLKTYRLSLLLVFFIFWMTVARADDFVAGYHLEGKFLLLGQDMRNADGTLKSFLAMTPDEISTIYHELWHAWFLENNSSRRNLLHDRFQNKANRLYSAHPEDKRLEIHEEAVADFIDAVVGTTVQMRRFVLAKPPEQRARLMGNPNFKNIYSKMFQDEYTGYYTHSIRTPGVKAAEPGTAFTSTTTTFAWNIEDNPGLSYFVMNPERVMQPFIDDAETFRLPVRYLREAVRSLKGVVFLSSIGLPIAAVPELRATPSGSAPTAKPENNSRDSVTTEDYPTSSDVAQTGNLGAKADNQSKQSLVDNPIAPTKDSSTSVQEYSEMDPVGRVTSSFVSRFLGGGHQNNKSLLQSDIITSDIPLDRDDKTLVERYLFEGRLSPQNFLLLGQE